MTKYKIDVFPQTEEACPDAQQWRGGLVRFERVISIPRLYVVAFCRMGCGLRAC
jgi:hypothetical protein